MTSHTSTYNQGSRPKPAIRRNRDLLPSELHYIQEEKVQNDYFIAQLQFEMRKRTSRLRDAREAVKMKGVECEHAELRLKAATSIREELAKIRENFSLPADLPTCSDVEQIASGLEDASPNLLAVADSLNMGSSFIKDIGRRVEEANVAVRMAQDAVCRSLEEEQVALIRENQCISILDMIQRSIDEILRVNTAQESRAIFRVHDEIWRQIFLEVASNNENTIDPFPSLTMAAVSYSWRTNALSYPALWRQICMKAFGFSSKDTERVTHYRERGGNRLLQVRLELTIPASDASLGLIVQSLLDMGTVDSLTITGNPAGSITRGLGRSIGASVLDAIHLLRRLEISYPLDFPPKRHSIPDHIIGLLEELVLRNAHLNPFTVSVQAARPTRLLSLTLAIQLPIGLRWDLFSAWIGGSNATLQYLQLEANFLPHQPPINALPVVFPQLSCVRADPAQLLLLFRSSIYTPSLRSLLISRSAPVDIESWQTYATDARGGQGTTSVTIVGDIANENVISCCDCLRLLPRLEKLTLRGTQVGLMLQALTPMNETARPLAKLHELTIVDYKNNGNTVAAFACQYRLNPNPGHPSRLGAGCSLRAYLQNCPNISLCNLQELKEIGAMD